jgi:hypothetical protein
MVTTKWHDPEHMAVIGDALAVISGPCSMASMALISVPHNGNGYDTFDK